MLIFLIHLKIKRMLSRRETSKLLKDKIFSKILAYSRKNLKIIKIINHLNLSWTMRQSP
jgi:hypothetical protein